MAIALTNFRQRRERHSACSSWAAAEQPTPRFATAVHQASDAVYALSYGPPADELSIRQQGNAIGSCWFRHSGASPEVFLAGLQGERLLIPETDIRVANTDFQEAASRLPLGADIDALVGKVRLRIYSLWAEVHRLATALHERGKLDKGEILRAARMPRSSWL
jgi:hypothetical protein